jgi:hypothetical protein
MENEKQGRPNRGKKRRPGRKIPYFRSSSSRAVNSMDSKNLSSLTTVALFRLIWRPTKERFTKVGIPVNRGEEGGISVTSDGM